MSAQDIMNMVGNGMYPIAISAIMLWWFTQDYKKEQEKTREVINELKESINAITQMATIYVKYIEKKDEKDE